MNETDSWVGYYKKKSDPFRNHVGHYQHALDVLSGDNLGLVLPDGPAVFIQGGFHPRATFPDDVINFWKNVRPGINDRYVLLDMNPTPFQAFNCRAFIGVRALLEDLPFAKGSVGGVILDGTLDFMNDGQIRKFSQAMSELLDPKGLVLCLYDQASFGFPVWTFASSIFRSVMVNKVKTYVRSDCQLKYLMCPLKPVMEADISGDYSLIVFSHPDSLIPQHEDGPYAFPDYYFEYSKLK